MKKVLSDVKFMKGKYSCMYSSLMNIINYYQYNLSESDVFFITDGFNMEYDPKLNHILGYNTCEYALNEISEDFLQTNYHNSFTSDELLNDVRNAIENNDLVLLIMNHDFLDYHHIFETAHDRMHAMIMYGIDDEKEHIYIRDSFLINSDAEITTYSGTLSFDNFIKGTLQYAIIKKNRLKEIKPDIVYKRVIKNIDRYFNDVSFHNGIFRRKRALEQFIKDFSKVLEIKDKNLYKVACENIHTSIRIECILPTLFYMKELLLQIQTNASEKDILLKAFIKINMAWIKTSHFMIKSSLKETNSSNIEKVIDDCLETINLQNELFADFKNFFEHHISLSY